MSCVVLVSETKQPCYLSQWYLGQPPTSQQKPPLSYIKPTSLHCEVAAPFSPALWTTGAYLLNHIGDAGMRESLALWVIFSSVSVFELLTTSPDWLSYLSRTNPLIFILLGIRSPSASPPALACSQFPPESRLVVYKPPAESNYNQMKSRPSLKSKHLEPLHSLFFVVFLRCHLPHLIVSACLALTFSHKT